ncbi:MAG: hypothetical protein AB8G18_15665, partial [Gammaproteobacteria bacterium]
LFATPAMLAASVLEHDLSTALNPVALARIIKTLGVRYVSVFIIVAIGYLASTLVSELVGSRLINIVASLYGLFLLCCAVGRLVFVSRVELGLNITSPKEFREQQDRQQTLNLDNNALQTAQQKSRLSPIEAASGLWEYHNRANSDPSRRFYAFDNLRKWSDPHTALRYAQPFTHYLFTSDSKDNAIEVVRWCMITEPQFRLDNASTTYALGVYAASIAQFKLAAFILQDMGKRYPEDPNSIAALIMTGKIAAQKLGDKTLLKNVIDQLSALGISREDPKLDTLIQLLNNFEQHD